MRMLRAQEDINTFSTPTLLSESDGTGGYQKGTTLCGVWCRQAWKHALFFVRGNVMIVDAIKVFLRRILNQKQAINKYAKMGSSGFLGKRERGEVREEKNYLLQTFVSLPRRNPFSQRRVLEGER